MKTVLAVLPLQPHSNGGGSQKRAAAHLAALTAVARVHLVVIDLETTAVVSSEQHLLSRCASVSLVRYQRRPLQPLARVPPFAIIAEYFNPAMQRMRPPTDLLREAFAYVAGQHVDIVLCYRLWTATIFDYARSVVSIGVGKRIVDFDDIDSLASKRASAFERLGVEQFLIEWLVRRRLRRAEDYYLRNYDAVWVCSDKDRTVLQSRRPAAAVHAVPNGIPLMDRAPPRHGNSVVRLLFVGKLSYGPNHDGIVWFCRDILPLIRAASPHRVGLTIVGYNPPAAVKALDRQDEIIVIGAADSLASYYYESDVVVVPVRYGSGTRIKILEAMSYERPVVSTSLGAEGIDVTPGKDIAIGDGPSEFASLCVELIQDCRRRERMAREGRRLVEEKYNELAVAAIIGQLI